MNAHTQINHLEAAEAEIAERELTGLRIADPAAFLARMAQGAKLAPTLEEAVSSGVKVCGPEFGDFLAQRYGGRVASIVKGG